MQSPKNHNFGGVRNGLTVVGERGFHNDATTNSQWWGRGAEREYIWRRGYAYYGAQNSINFEINLWHEKMGVRWDKGTVHDVWPNLIICVQSSRSSATQQSTSIQQHTAVSFLVVESSHLWWGSRNGVMRAEIWRWKLDGPGWKVLDCKKTQQHTAKSRLVPRGRCPEEGTDMSISLIWGQGFTIHLFIAKNMKVRKWWAVPDIGPYLTLQRQPREASISQQSTTIGQSFLMPVSAV